jgi:hypothetical protein
MTDLKVVRDTPEWFDAIAGSLPTTNGPSVVALARLLAELDDTPPPLRVIASTFLEARLYRADRPRARGTDPSTSQDAAEAVRGPARPGGKVHRILDAYRLVTTGMSADNYPHGMTSREVEFVANVRAAHKRTSELLADGLLEVVPDDVFDNGDMVRKGGRVLRITDDGRTELARLDAAGRRKREEEEARLARRKAREARRSAKA